MACDWPSYYATNVQSSVPYPIVITVRRWYGTTSVCTAVWSVYQGYEYQTMDDAPHNLAWQDRSWSYGLTMASTHSAQELTLTAKFCIPQNQKCDSQQVQCDWWPDSSTATAQQVPRLCMCSWFLSQQRHSLNKEREY